MAKILVCDDEKDIVEALNIYLSSEYEVVKAYNGHQAIQAVKGQNIDLIILDIMMPEMDGLQAIHQLRQFTNVPIIFLSAKGEDVDKVLGLDLGADDYITKPFNPTEVLARVRSHLRRYTQLGSNITYDGVYKCGGIMLDDNKKEVNVDGNVVDLTPMEYGILLILLKNPGKVLSIDEIYKAVWKEDLLDGNEGTVTVHIRHLREKIEINPSEPRYLKVVWGHGYRLEDRQ